MPEQRTRRARVLAALAERVNQIEAKAQEHSRAVANVEESIDLLKYLLDNLPSYTPTSLQSNSTGIN